MSVTFEDLIAPHSPETFIEDTWEKAHLYVARGEPSFYDTLFCLADIDKCLHTARTFPDKVLTIVPPSDSGRAMQDLPAGEASLDQVYKELHAGATIRLLDIERFWPAAAVLSGEIFQALNATTCFNVYLTPPKSQAFSVHFDYSDVFVLQIQGSKEWSVFEAEYPMPMESLSRCSQGRMPPQVVDEDSVTLRQQIHLEAGDLLYVPRGFYHKVATTDETSLHISVGIHPTSWLDLVKQSLDFTAFEQAELRRALPPGFLSSETVRQGMAATMRRLAEILADGLPHEAALDSMVRSQIRGRLHPPDGHLAELAKISDLHLGSTVRHRAGLLCRVSTSADQAVLHFGPTEVSAPLAVLPALQLICDNRQLKVGDLPPPLSDNSKLVLIRRLIREGLLRVVEDSPG